MHLFLFLGLCSVTSVALAKPDLKLPFPDGESWVLTRAYTTGTHTNYGTWADDRYALDFVEAGCLSMGKPVLAAADGVVEVQSFVDQSGYGINLLINHGGGYKSRYAHLASIAVPNGKAVKQGEQIGVVGNTGYVLGSACPQSPGMHLYFALYYNGVGVKPEPISGYSGLVAGKSYTSDNAGQDSYEYNGSLVACAGPVVGGADTGWLYACYDVGKRFAQGETVYALVRIENIKRSHRFRVRAYKNNTYQWEWAANWNYVGAEGWQYSHFWPALSNPAVGKWELKIDVDTGGGFKLIDSVQFFIE